MEEKSFNMVIGYTLNRTSDEKRVSLVVLACDITSGIHGYTVW